MPEEPVRIGQAAGASVPRDRGTNTNSIAFGNARGVRNIFERVLVEQANRLSGMECPTGRT
jgi:hypothetical protein